MLVYKFAILLFLISFLPKIRSNKKLIHLVGKFNDYKFTSFALLIWISIGFITRLDFSQMHGDVLFGEDIFDYNNIGFAFISFSLILLAQKSNKSNTRKVFLIIESSIWLFRFLRYKGGYAMGFSANYPLDLIVFYDIVSIVLRIKLLDKAIASFKLKNRLIIIITFLLIAVKIFLLPYPNSLEWEVKRIANKTDIAERLVIGEWIGIVHSDSIWEKQDNIADNLNQFFDIEINENSLDSTDRYQMIELSDTLIDSVQVKINQDLIIRTKHLNCYMNFRYYNWGDLNQIDSGYYGRFKIIDLSQDTLILTISKMFTEKYRYYLKRN